MRFIIVVMLLFLTTLSAIGQKDREQLNSGPDHDYLSELKEQLQLKWPENRTINIVFHGHSVPAGYFTGGLVNTLAAYPHLTLKFLKEHYPKAVINCITTSIGGEQSEQGAERFRDDVLCMKPDLLFIDYALNDRRIGLDRSEKAWRSMIQEALDYEVKLVLMTPTPDLTENILDPNTPLASYSNMIQRLGVEYDVPVVNVYGRFKSLKASGTDISKLMSQNNHPNELGHQVVLEEIVSELFNNLVYKQPNIILIVTDDQGYADLSAFKHVSANCRTPNMDRIADSGILFDNCYVSGPVCSPSRAAIYTGKYQERWDRGMGWRPGLPLNVSTLAEILSDNGYVTGRIGKSDYGTNYHNPSAREFPSNHGYNSFLGFSAHAHDYFLLDEAIEKATPDPYGESESLGRLFRDTAKVGFTDTYTTDLFTDEAIEFLKKHGSGPFFLDIAYNSVHELIHEVPDEYLEKWGAPKIPNYDPSYGEYADYYWDYTQVGKITDEEKRKLYLANLNCLDDNIGRLLDTLEYMDLLENTMVLLISDNGGEPLTGANNLPLSGSKYTMHEGGIRVPFIIAWPAKLPKGALYRHRVSGMDIVPTCLEAAGISLDKSIWSDGNSLIGPVKKNIASAKAEKPLCFKFGNQWAIIDKGWKLVYAEDYNPVNRPITSQILLGSNSGKLALYNLHNDIAERNNLIEQEPEKTRELQEKFDSWMEEMKADHSNYQFWTK